MITFIAFGRVLILLLSCIFITKVIDSQPPDTHFYCPQSDLIHLTLKNSLMPMNIVYRTYKL